MLNFTGSNTNGLKAEIRQSETPYEKGYSVFTWRDTGNGVTHWRENHELTWPEAFSIAKNWIN